jgi:6-pyruvoyltetrahydropterin/6-carboxytetrahydropterin synthase
MAHALWNYDGLCRNLHGHSYILRVTVVGEPVEDESNPKLGMVMDFGDLKSIVKSEILDSLDHSIVLSKSSDVEAVKQLSQMAERTIVVDYQPTCENLLLDFAEKIKRRLPVNIELFSLRLNETANSYAEWYASDNV